eukprot:6601765-Prymnesium_polylepis.1
MSLGKLEAGGTLQVDAAIGLVRQPIGCCRQPLAHERHGAVLERCDARPLERRLLEEGVADLRARRHLELGHTPFRGPLGDLAVELPL